MPDTYPFIGTLAQALYIYDVHIRLSALGKILHDKGLLAYSDGFDIGSLVAAAYHYWASRNAQTARAIRDAFTGEAGEALVPVLGGSEPTAGADLEHSG